MDTLDTATDDTRRALIADAEIREGARAHAWCAAGAQTMRVEDGKLTGIPPGWPRIVSEPEKYITDYVDNMLYRPEE